MHRIETHPGARHAAAGAPRPAITSLLPGRRRGRSRAALNLRGLCPVCGNEAGRRVTATPTATRETYCCPVDGETVYLVDRRGRRIETHADRLQHGRRRAALRPPPGVWGPMVPAPASA